MSLQLLNFLSEVLFMKRKVFFPTGYADTEMFTEMFA